MKGCVWMLEGELKSRKAMDFLIAYFLEELILKDCVSTRND